MALTNLGTCPNCHQTNSYSVPNCIDCGTRLPWADAIQQAAAAAPVATSSNSVPAMVSTSPPTAVPNGGWQTSPTGSTSFPITDLAPSSVGLLISVLVFCVGYFMPWVNVSIFLVSIGVGGIVGVELLALIAGLAVAALALQPYFLKVPDAFPVHRFCLSVGCLAFGLGESLYWGLVSPMVQLGIGAILMAVGAAGMSFFALKQLPQPLVRNSAGFAVSAVILVMVGVGLNAQQQRASMYAALGNLNNGATNPFTPSNLPAFSETRSDVVVKLNSNYRTATMASKTGMTGSYAADAGKEFLVCNVTVSFTGRTGSLDVTHSKFKLEGSNKQVYQGSLFFEDLATVNLISATLLPGGTATGDVVFEVDSGVQPVSVSFSGF